MSMMNSEHDMRMSQHLHNSLAISNSTEFDTQTQSQQQHHHSKSNNKNYRTPASTPSFTAHNKQSVLANLSKSGYDDANQAANSNMNVI